MKIKTNDQIISVIDENIVPFIGLLNDIREDFDSMETVNLSQISQSDLLKVISFINDLEFEHFEIRRPFYNYKVIVDEKINSKQKLRNFFEQLTIENIIEYFRISDFLNVPSLENILYLKLAEIFSSKTNISNYFKLNENELDLTEEKRIALLKKYTGHFNFDHLSNEEIDNILEDLD